MESKKESTADNQEKNKLHYEKLYSNFSIKNILFWIQNLDKFLDNAISAETSWYGLYQEGLREKIVGKRVVEMGCGDCTNAAVMAALGAQVFANDIASTSGEIIKKLNESFKFNYPITFVEGDFLNNKLPSSSFDFVIGKAFLHHLELPEEKLFLQETARLLNNNGEARFFEPAVNSRILDAIRWHIPVKNRPSKFNKKAFRQWKINDPHPDRSFSSAHFEEAGKEFFKEVMIKPVGTLERFSRFFSWGEKRNRYKRWALRNEIHLPLTINRILTRSQLIIYRKPL